MVRISFPGCRLFISSFAKSHRCFYGTAIPCERESKKSLTLEIALPLEWLHCHMTEGFENIYSSLCVIA